MSLGAICFQNKNYWTNNSAKQYCCRRRSRSSSSWTFIMTVRYSINPLWHPCCFVVAIEAHFQRNQFFSITISIQFQLSLNLDDFLVVEIQGTIFFYCQQNPFLSYPDTWVNQSWIFHTRGEIFYSCRVTRVSPKLFLDCDNFMSCNSAMKSRSFQTKWDLPCTLDSIECCFVWIIFYSSFETCESGGLSRCFCWYQ